MRHRPLLPAEGVPSFVTPFLYSPDFSPQSCNRSACSRISVFPIIHSSVGFFALPSMVCFRLGDWMHRAIPSPRYSQFLPGPPVSYFSVACSAQIRAPPNHIASSSCVFVPPPLWTLQPIDLNSPSRSPLPLGSLRTPCREVFPSSHLPDRLPHFSLLLSTNLPAFAIRKCSPVSLKNLASVGLQDISFPLQVFYFPSFLLRSLNTPPTPSPTTPL